MDKPDPLTSTIRVDREPLRILMVVNLPWDVRLGAVRVWMELAKQWTKAGHNVEKFCLTDAFPRPTESRGLSSLRLIWFPRRAARYVRQNAHRFNIIDAHTGTLPFSKERLGFNGLLVSRSVGLYRSYEQFTRSIKWRWPDQPRGKFLGRFFYWFITWKLARLSDRSIRFCDLINVPNEEELSSLRNARATNKPIIVQPYGLNASDRTAFTAAAQPAGVRLQNKEICFIGMWSLRKGSRDWAELIRQIRSAIPDAKFTFLGTMTDDQTLFRDLHVSKAENIRHVPSYDPSELPNLLASGTVGVFPSYIEGFGLAVLEQLAAGIPTVAYDVPGPRQILKPLGDAVLALVGDTAALAARAIAILRADLSEYEKLREQCLAIAGQFSWSEIAAETVRAYRRAFDSPAGAIVFTHPFGLQSPSGGSRIMRALLQDNAIRFVSICTSPEQPPPTHLGIEVHIPLRPSFGRIERTRFAVIADAFTSLFSKRFARRLEAECIKARAIAVHSIVHGGMDFYTAFLVARKLNIPFFIHVHDDFIFSARGIPSEANAHAALREAWLGATARFVICRALGDEYCRRYGQREYLIITDGLENIAAEPKKRAASSELRIYFMGLFHLDYEPNLHILLTALAQLRNEGRDVFITMRCGGVRRSLIKGYENLVRILPFASESVVQSDLEQADLLYLPLPFEKKYELFVRFSLSTKMVTYIGSGIPILYHGPRESAVYGLLQSRNASLSCTKPALDPLVVMLREFIDDHEMGAESSRNALALAKSDFMLNDIRRKFWDAIREPLPA